MKLNFTSILMLALLILTAGAHSSFADPAEPGGNGGGNDARLQQQQQEPQQPQHKSGVKNPLLYGQGTTPIRCAENLIFKKIDLYHSEGAVISYPAGYLANGESEQYFSSRDSFRNWKELGNQELWFNLVKYDEDAKQNVKLVADINFVSERKSHYDADGELRVDGLVNCNAHSLDICVSNADAGSEHVCLYER